MCGVFPYFLAFLGRKTSQSRLENLTSGNLLVVAGQFSLNDVLVARKSVSVVHVAQFPDKLVHHQVVGLLLGVNQLSLRLNDLIIASAIRQQELIIDLDIRCLDTLLGSNQFSLLHRLLSLDFADILFQLFELEVGVGAAMAKSEFVAVASDVRRTNALQVVARVHRPVFAFLRHHRWHWVLGRRVQLGNEVPLVLVAGEVLLHIHCLLLCLVQVAGKLASLEGVEGICLQKHHFINLILTA